MSDEPGVMGNLPRSRPGRRSSKREGARKTAAAADATADQPASKPAAGRSAAGRPTRKKQPAKTAAGRKTTQGSRAGAARTSGRATSKPPAAEPRDQQRGTDPVTGAVLLAGKVVEGGLKVAGDILKRLPRP